MWVVGNTAFIEGYFNGSRLGGSIADTAKGSVMRVRYLQRIDIQDRMIKLVHSYYDTALFYQIQPERSNARLKDEFGGKNLMVKGDTKVMSHLMFGVLALSADQLMRLDEIATMTRFAQSPTPVHSMMQGSLCAES